jgi:uncharacterized phage protein gp47/JayE
MTIQGDEFIIDGKEAILTALVEGAEDAFGQQLDPDEVSIIRSHYEPLAEYLASQQEDIKSVLDSVHIDSAEGAQLDLLAGLIGVQRRPATAATTLARFSRDSKTPRDYTVPRGTKFQTDAVDAVNFETTEINNIEFIDGFEDNDISNYVGDTGSFATSTAQVFDGNYAMEATAAGSIYDSVNYDFRRESKFHVQQRLTTSAVGGILVGVQDANNHYRISLDQGGGSVDIEVVDGGSVVSSSTTSFSVPANEWLELIIDWQLGGVIDVTVEDSTDNELATVTIDETDATYEDGGVGFYSGGSNTKYWDNFTMSAVGVQSECTETGTVGNVGANSLIVLADAPNGIDDVTNPAAATGGSEKEQDDDFRERAQAELSEGINATLPALISRLQNLEPTRTVSVIVNDTSTTDGDGRPPHSFEAIVDVDSTEYGRVAERILETKAAGDISVGGYDGTAVTQTVELSNGQDKDITFSTPAEVKIYVDCDLQKTDVYDGDAQVQDNIVQYLGGTLSSGDNTSGELGVGDDVIYNQVLEAVMDVEGVYDVTNLEVDTNSSPTGTSNVTIAETDTATADANDGSLDITSNDV